MADKPGLEFGYCPPAGERGMETIHFDRFIADLHRAVDVAVQGFSSLWISDHLMFGAKYRMECWTELVWLAARYPHVRLGTVVLANSFRNPALLAKMAATLQALSGGRFILGYGAGWAKEEYEGYGYEFPPPGQRLAMMEEGIQVMRALWSQAPANFSGQYYRLANAYCEPRPAPAPILMIGGSGEQRTLRLVARYADWWNDSLRPMDQLKRKLDLLRQYCRDEGRDYASLHKSQMGRIFIDRSHQVALGRAALAPQDGQRHLAGDPAAIREQLTELAEVGLNMVQLVFRNFPETDDLRLFMDEVLPAFR